MFSTGKTFLLSSSLNKLYILKSLISSKCLDDKRIIYNCLASAYNNDKNYKLRRQKRSLNIIDKQGGSVYLQCLEGPKTSDANDENSVRVPNLPKSDFYPYNRPVKDFNSKILILDQGNGSTECYDQTSIPSIIANKIKFLREKAVKEHLDQAAEDNDALWILRYGNPDPSLPVSRIICGGCGAFLHSQNSSWPGYLPGEVMQAASDDELVRFICQRCYFLQYYNVSLNVQVPINDYANILSRIDTKNAMIVVMVDLLDLPASIWSGTVDIIDPSIPVMVVGNKVDLLPQIGRRYLDSVMHCLNTSLDQAGFCKLNIIHTSLISAITGYGVENLITQIQTQWFARGDIYLFGSTNVGKSSLFNALLMSDMCRSTSVDLIRRATISQWPGTTLNLLKFPMRHVNEHVLRKRQKRLRREKIANENDVFQGKSRTLSNETAIFPAITGYIGRTFFGVRNYDENSTVLDNEVQDRVPLGGLALDDDRIPLGVPCFYDTPGSVTDSQIISKLTQEELLLTLSRDVIRPRTFTIDLHHSLLLAGIARLDYTGGPSSVSVSVFASKHLPVTIVRTENSDAVYEMLLQEHLLVVPQTSSANRMLHWPALKPVSVEVSTNGRAGETASDITLSSAGWVSVAKPSSLETEVSYKFVVYTPGGVGISIRTPSMLPCTSKVGRQEHNSRFSYINKKRSEA